MAKIEADNLSPHTIYLAKSIETQLGLENVDIKGNTASYGGGIYLHDSPIRFHPVNRCNIFLNHAILQGNDLYTNEKGLCRKSAKVAGGAKAH